VGGGPMTTAFAGRRVLVTAGPTFEDIDPVRFIGNRSTSAPPRWLTGVRARSPRRR